MMTSAARNAAMRVVASGEVRPWWMDTWGVALRGAWVVRVRRDARKAAVEGGGDGWAGEGLRRVESAAAVAVGY